MLVAIYAYEQIFCGLHGMCTHTVVEVANEEEAEEYAIAESIDVITSYSEIMENLEENYHYEYDDNEEEFEDEILDELINDDVAYEIYKITKETTESLEQLNQKFYRDPEGFLEEYCKEEDF